MLWAQQVDQAEEYIQKSINLLTEFGETRELAWYRLYLGKCFAARLDHRAAREQFRKVIEEGQELGKVHLVYYGLLDIAKTYLAEGKTEKALEISLALCHCPIEYEGIQNLNDQLFEELQTVLPKEIVEAVRKQVDEKITPDQTGAVALAYAFEQITG
jgi:tetratricopeptide (TPR) repeat protein